MISAFRDRRPSPTATACVYVCHADALDEAALAFARGLLSREERTRHDRLARPDDRRDFAAAHALLRLALAARMGVPPRDLAFGADSSGRPFLVSPAGTPQAPAFSLAHARGVVACALADGAIGVDVEAIAIAGRAARAVERLVAPAEAAAIAAAPEDERPARVCELWTLKEALFKALGLGLALPLDSVSFLVDGGRVACDTRLGIAADEWRFMLRDVGGTHKLAVAMRAPVADLTVQEVHGTQFADVPF